MIVPGGRNLYGFLVGVVMLDTRFPRLPGDIGNATTWPFPVLYRPVAGASPARVVLEADRTLIEPFCEAARDLARAGCRAITTSCGFLAIFHRELAAAVSVPVATSALLQVPLVARMLAPGQKVGILTAHAPALTEAHFTGVGWSSDTVPVVIGGLEEEPAWQNAILANGPTLDREAVEAAVVRQARQMLGREPAIGAFVLECTNMPPYAAAIQRATSLPVFDIVTLVNLLAAAAHRTEFAGWM